MVASTETPPEFFTDNFVFSTDNDVFSTDNDVFFTDYDAFTTDFFSTDNDVFSTDDDVFSTDNDVFNTDNDIFYTDDFFSPYPAISTPRDDLQNDEMSNVPTLPPVYQIDGIDVFLPPELEGVCVVWCGACVCVCVRV